MSDVFSALIGQDRAIAHMRELAQRPVHAYVLTGPDAGDLAVAARAFATAIVCPAGGCAQCEVCRAGLAGTEVNIISTERSGASWSVEDIHGIEDVARRRPFGPRQVVIVEEIDLASTAVAALLKTLEEPGPRTSFVLTATSLEDLDTVASRCVQIRLAPLSVELIVTTLTSDGVMEAVARDCAVASLGSLARARLLVRDPGLRERLTKWRQFPADLSRDVGSALEAASAVQWMLDAALSPLAAQQEEDLARRNAEAKAFTGRVLSGKRDLEAQYKREQARFRRDELAMGLATMAEVYRETLIHQSHDVRVVAETTRVLEILQTAQARLATNLNETLLLTDLFLALRPQ